MSVRFGAVILAVLVAFSAVADDERELAIASFSGDGDITFAEVEDATSYRVEWSLTGQPWTNFTGAAGQRLNYIPATGSGVVTASVADTTDMSRMYRVVATVRLTTPPDPTNMAFIAGGTFDMGDPFYEGEANELPVHSVALSPYWIDAYEVTYSNWMVVRAWGGGNGYQYANPGSGKGMDHPVQTVSWYDSLLWCNARSEMEGRLPAYYTDTNFVVVVKVRMAPGQYPAVNPAANGYRLPTEAQWEMAARGGLVTNRFPWGQFINHSNANYRANRSYPYDDSVYTSTTYHPDYDNGSHPYTSPVGSFPPNGYGLYDMTGNVWEWCWDWFTQDYYDVLSTATNTPVDPTGPAYGPDTYRRSFRGGAWNGRADMNRLALRGNGTPEYKYIVIGFRTVLMNVSPSP